MHKLAKTILDDGESVFEKIDLTPLTGKTIMITGASGLVGTYLLAVLKKFALEHSKSIKTVVVVGHELLLYQKELLDYPGAKCIVGDLSDYDFCRSLPKADYIIHAAGYGQPGRFMQNPKKTLKINTLATFVLLEKLEQNGSFLFISSSELYSGSTNIPYKETDIGNTNTTHPRACYIEGKRSGEAICGAYRGQGKNTKCARLALAYGPGTKRNDERVLNSFIQKAITEGKIALLDAGQARRTYLYITDAIEILWKILLEGKESLYNVGGNSKTTIRELGDMIGKNLEVPVEIPKSETHADKSAPSDVWLDMTKVESEFGKTDYVPLEEGLQKTIEWQKILYRS